MRTSTRCNRDVPQGRTRFLSSVKLFLMLFLLGSFLIPAKVSAQIIRIDGNPSDWSNNATVSHRTDKYNIINQDTIFAGNEKDFMFAVPDWHWKLGTAKDKNDIANGAAGLVGAVDTVDASNVVHHLTGDFLVFAGDRISNSGDAQIGFWFFQDGTAPVAGGNFSPEKHTTPRPGDVLVLADFTGGGRNGKVTVLEFVGSGGNYAGSAAFNDLTTSVGAAVAENNDADGLAIPTGWVFTDKQTGTSTYSHNEFYEGYIDLSIFGGGRHFCPSTFQLETRSSQEMTAVLDDFVNGPLAGAPQPPTVQGNSRCGSGSITISATCTGTTVRWYTAASGGSPITTGGIYTVSGSSLTINPLSATTTYYASCYNSTTGCESERVAVTATINPSPVPTAHNLTSCETGSTGAASFDLNTAINSADGGTITFYTTLTDAQNATNAIATPGSYSVNVGSPATIYVRSVNGTCYGTTSFTVTVTDNPDVTAHNLTSCENGSTGAASFNLNNAIDNADGGTVSFYTSLANAQAGTSAIATPGSYSVNVGSPVTIYVRSANGSCFGTTSFTVTVTDNPDVTAHNLTSCENGSTGAASFNLNNAIDNADGGTVSFYTSLANAQAGTSAIATPGSYSVNVGSPVTIYVRSANGSCFGTTSFTVTVTDNPDVIAHNLTACESSSGAGSASVNLTTAINDADGGTVSFYTSLADAQAGTNAIATPGSYSVNVGPPVTIYVRSANGSCFGTTSFTVTVTANATANAGTATPQCRNSIAGTNTFGTNTFNLSGSGSGGTPSWSVFANPQGYTVNIINGNTYTPTVELSGASVNGGSVTMRLTVSGGTCGTATSDVVLTLTALPIIYTVTGTDFCPNAPNTGTITLSGSEVGVNYQLSKDGIIQAGQDKAGTGSSLVWTNLSAGNYSVIGTRIGTSCSTTSGPDNVAENNAPDPSVTNLTSCENGSTGGASFNLNNAITAADGGTITFYNSQADAIAKTNAISASQTVTVAASPKTFWVRSENATTGCFGVRSFTVTVTDNPDVTTTPLTSCESGTSTTATFNLNNGVTNADGGTLTFYTSQADATAGTNAIVGPTTYVAHNGDVIYVRSTNGTCFGTASFTITVTDNPDVTVQNLSSCETGTTGHATFNLNNGVTNADGGTVTFYASQSDANAGTNAIGSPTTYSAPIGTTTIWVRDANGTCATVTSFTITVHANPTPTADNKEVCAGSTVDLTGSPAGGIWSGAHVIGSTFDATGVAAGNYTVTYTVTDGFGCTGSTTATVSVKACGGPLCTYTQGYYGNTNGNSCDADGTGTDPITYQNPVDLITAQLLNGGTLTVGISGRSVYLPVPTAATTAARVNSVMPGNSTPKELTVASDVDINSGTFTTAYLNKQGKINNVLLSQTITLGLNMRISSGLPDFALQAGEFATATPDGPCGTKTTKPQCTYSDVYPYGLIGGDTYVYKTITADVIAALNAKSYPLTVTGLFWLANDALGNADATVGTEGGASLSAINAAVDAINTGFDKCRVFVGWNVAHCSLTDPNLITSSGASRTSNTGLATIGQTDKLSVSAYPNPFNDVVKFTIQSKVSGNAQLTVYNMLGQRINTVYNGYVQANKNISIEYKTPRNAQQNLIYILSINGEKVTGKVLNIRD